MPGDLEKGPEELGVKIEYGGTNCPDDKPYIERFFSRYKFEEVYHNDYCSFSDALYWGGSSISTSIK